MILVARCYKHVLDAFCDDGDCGAGDGAQSVDVFVVAGRSLVGMMFVG